MLTQFNLDLSQLAVADGGKGSQISAGNLTPVSSTQRDLIKGACVLGKSLNSTLGGFADVADVSITPPSVVVVPSPTIPLFGVSTSPSLTIALGATGSVAMVAGIVGSGGIYGSTTGEFGIFGTAGFFIGVASGSSVGGELSFIFGAPSDFSGPFISIVASVAPTGGLVSVGGSLIFAPGPVTASGTVSLIFMGFSLTLSAGISALPFSAAIEWSDTAIVPVIHI
jgi:hypothetical protein